MSFAPFVKTLVYVTNNSPSQDYTHLDNHLLINLTPGNRPFTKNDDRNVLFQIYRIEPLTKPVLNLT